MSRRSRKKESWRTVWSYAVGAAVVVPLLYTHVSAGMALGLGLALLLLLGKLLIDESVDRVVSAQDDLFAQYESREQLNQLLQPRHPLPTTRGHRGSPDFLLEIQERITATRPEFVLEASCGLSTIVCAYALQQLGSGRVVSLEHEAFFAEETRRRLDRHGLTDVARVHHAPIVRHVIDGKPWLWYDLTGAELPPSLDMIIVDGPPHGLQKKARYPALPLLINRLKVGGVLLLDDADRGGERRSVADWQARYPNIRVDWIPLEKGLAVITKLAD